jgi:hypothetical protein
MCAFSSFEDPLLTSEIDILSPTTVHGIWAMADLIFRDGDAPTD